MEVAWSVAALNDLERVYNFLLPANSQAASEIFKRLYTAPEALAVHPRIGVLLDQFHPREVRRLVVDQYELRYEVRANAVIMLRLWHTKEYR